MPADIDRLYEMRIARNLVNRSASSLVMVEVQHEEPGVGETLRFFMPRDYFQS